MKDTRWHCHAGMEEFSLWSSGWDGSEGVQDDEADMRQGKRS